MCSMVEPRLDVLWSRDSIFGARYWIVPTWPPAAAWWRAFCPSYRKEIHNNWTHDWNNNKSGHEQWTLMHGQHGRVRVRTYYDGITMHLDTIENQNIVCNYNYAHACLIVYYFETIPLLYSLCSEHSQDSLAPAGLSLWRGLLYVLHQERCTPAPAQETQLMMFWPNWNTESKDSMKHWTSKLKQLQIQ